MSGADPRLQLRRIGKSFPGVRALDGVDLDLRAGEVLALVGENGAGKSTLIKIIAGAHRPDAGDLLLDGVRQRFDGPRAAAAAGIRVVYQELEVVAGLSVAENVFFGRLPARAWRVDWRALHDATAAVLARVGLEVPPQVKAGRLGVAARQLVEIARALAQRPRVLVLDEPTSALSPAEGDRLLALLRGLRADGAAILYVSHRLGEVRALADRVAILRDGRLVSTERTADLAEDEMIRRMVGRRVDGEIRRRRRTPGELLLEVEGLATQHVHGATFAARAGEVVGLFGLMGAGRTELLRAVVGADRRRAGCVWVAGRVLAANAPWAARDLGLGLVPEDRRAHGIFPRLNVVHNLTVSCLRQFASGGLWLRTRQEAEAARRIGERLGVRETSLDRPAAQLSGGNQQKLLLARWLLSRGLRVLLVDEPTRGIDVAARFEIYGVLDELAAQGLAIVLASSDLPELLGLCDRIYAMRGGVVCAELARDEATPERLLAAALG